MSRLTVYLTAIVTGCLLSAFVTFALIGPWMSVPRTKVTEQAVSIGRVWSLGTSVRYEYAAQNGSEVVTIARFIPFFSRYVQVDFNRNCDCVTELFFVDSDDTWVSVNFQPRFTDDLVFVLSELAGTSTPQRVSMTRSEALEQMREQIEEATSAREYLKNLVKT